MGWDGMGERGSPYLVAEADSEHLLLVGVNALQELAQF